MGYLFNCEVQRLRDRFMQLWMEAKVGSPVTWISELLGRVK